MKLRRPAPRLPLALALAVVCGVGVAACDEPTSPPVDTLGDLDEAAIHAAVSERMAAFNAGAGSATIFWSAVHDMRTTAGADPVVAPELIPPMFHGSTLVYNAATQRWSVDDQRTGAPADGVRIIWYRTTDDGRIQTPLAERGHIDARNLPATQISWTEITVFSDQVGTTVADYILGFDEFETPGRWDMEFQFVGVLGNGTVQVDVDFVFTGHENIDAGDDLFTYDLAISNPGFDYRFVGTDSFDPGTGLVTEEFDINATIDGVNTRVAFVAETSESAFQASGHMRHRGVRIADITFSGDRIEFWRPDGTAYSARESEKLATVLFALLAPYDAIDILFG